jgi:hypothetical protein
MLEGSGLQGTKFRVWRGIMAAENLDDDDKDIVTCHLHACLRLSGIFIGCYKSFE